MRLSFALAAVCLIIGVGAFAQSNQGTLTGTVSDPAAAVVPSAQLEVRNTATGVVYSGGTSSTGNFVFSVPAGIYEISVNAPGFKKFVQSNVQVISATDTRKDVTLEVGSSTETISVTDTAPLLKTESGELSHTVEIEQVNQLPVLTTDSSSMLGPSAMGQIRNPLQIATILPGVTFSNDNAMVVNGMPSNSESIRIEGQDATGNIWKSIQSLSQGASVDAIQEVTVQTSNFSAEYGQVGGGYFNLTMKSGTNQLHGSVYDYFVNEFLNAGLPFTDAGTQSPDKEGEHIRNAVRRNDYGFTVGGPIVIPKVYNGRNRTFFFVNFEQFRQSNTYTNGIATVPTAAYRNGDFSMAGCFAPIGPNTCAFSPPITYLDGSPAIDPAGQTLHFGEVFDPGTTRTVNGSQVRSPYPNQLIPASTFDPVAAKIQAMFPLPNAPGLINNYVIPAYVDWKHTTQWSFKVDHSVSSTIKLSYYFSRLLTNEPNANGIDGIFAAPNPTANRNVTQRANYDQTITPTLLFHVGVGYVQQYQPTDYPEFDQGSLGMHGYFQTNRFPSIGGIFDGAGATTNIAAGLGNFVTGGYGGPAGALGGIGPAFIAFLWEEKPTANTNLTWVKGNHTFKFGGELIIDGYPERSGWRANGAFGINNAETADPWQNNQVFNFANPTGFSYASFMLGLPDDVEISPNTQTKTGQHSMGFYAQDSWKVTRRLTVDYGLRYDYQTYLTEQHGRMPIAGLSTPNPTVGGLLGATLYGASCKCEFSHNYPWAFGPRVGVAYQINTKTVLRAGAGITYGVVQTPSGLQYSLADYYTFNATGYGTPPAQHPFEQNPYPNVTWPNYDPGKNPVLTAGLLPPSSPNTIFTNDARPPRMIQWSVGLQRELRKDLVAEATYVGNRGAWWAAPGLDPYQCNCLTDQILAAHGLNRNNPADLALLTDLIGSPQAIAAGFKPAYPGMPLTSTVNQQIRPIPQWASGGPSTFLGPPKGKTWYDSLQTKITKRYSHGLVGQASFVWSHATDLGAGAEAPIALGYNPIISDLFNPDNNKQLNQLSRPFQLIISGSYTTPGFSADSTGMKVLSHVVRDWQLGVLLRYQNGALIETPSSANQLITQLLRQGGFGGAPVNPDNRVPGVNPLAVDPNCGCFNPQTTQVLNAKAWAEPGPGQWGTAAPFYNDVRWQRQPAESMSFGRNFRMGKEGRYEFSIRAEFQNIFNRLFLTAPATGNQGLGPFGGAAITTSTAPVHDTNGVLTGGFGFVNTTTPLGGAAQPRSGQIVGRLTF
jgi:Carboxypeptidase regulatory-like domain/TonB dependent receptor